MNIKIGGLQKTSLIDYPGKIVASVFLAGCNFRCPYCHNPELIEIKPGRNYITLEHFFTYIEKRKNILDGVCVSGGEPLIYNDLDQFLKKIKALDLLIKLDTNGTNPVFLQKLIDLNLVDYLAMDIKASLDHYEQVTDVKVNLEDIRKSIDIIMKSGLDYEFRTTVLPKFHNLEEMEKIGKMIKGGNIYYIQKFRNGVTFDPKFNQEKTFTDAELKELKKIASKYVKKCEIRS